MNVYLLFAIGLILFIGISMMFYVFVINNSVVSEALATILVFAVMYGAGIISKFGIGVVALAVLGAVGIIAFLLKLRGSDEKKNFFSPGFAITIFVFVLFTILFKDIYVQNFDDLHQWALNVKFMFEKDTLPTVESFVGSSATMPKGTSLFILFFQEISGFNEGNMYAASQFLVWIGFAMAVSEFGWKDWKKVAVYFVTVFFAIDVFYYYGYKNMYVDLPLAGWTGGICGYWLCVKDRRSTKKEQHILYAVMAIMTIYLTQIKLAIGPLFACYVVFFILITSLNQHGFLNTIKKLKKYILWIIAAIVSAIAVVIVYYIYTGSRLIPLDLSGTIEALTFSSEKAKLTSAKMIHRLIFDSLHSSCGLRISTVAALGVVAAVWILVIILMSKKNRNLMRELTYYLVYMVITAVSYIVILYVTYVSYFSYEESVRAAAMLRYTGTYVIFVFVLMLVSLMKCSCEKRISQNIRVDLISVVSVVIMIVFGMCINENYINAVSAAQPEKNKGYESAEVAIADTRQLDSLLKEGDKVYFLTQNMDLENWDEYYMATILYYNYDRISGYVRNPWRYYEGGSYLFAKTRDDLTINEFETRLTNGKYTYVWLYTVDSYIREQFSRMYGMDDVVEGGIYKIVYENGEITGLCYAETIKTKMETKEK